MVLQVAAWLLVACFAPPGAPENRLGESQQVGKLVEPFRDPAEFARLIKQCDALHERWKDEEDADHYGGVMERELAGLHDYIGWRGTNWIEVDNRRLRALERQSEMELRTQEHLVLFLDTLNLMRSRPTLGEQAFRSRRQAHAMAILRAVAQAEREQDDSWDPENLPALNLVPPLATGLPSGVSSDAVKDPELRAIYERAIEANRKKAERHNQQSQIRRMEQHIFPFVRRRLVGMYSPDELDELGRQCKEVGVPPAWRDKLFEEVRQAPK
jgi:hypothetical protein